MIKSIQLARTVCIEPQFIDSNIKTHLFEKARSDWEGKCTKDEGFITKVFSIQKVVDNYISPATSGLIFELVLNVETMKPRVGDVFSQTVVQIIPQGFYTKNVILIYVPVSETEPQTSVVTENDVVNVSITSIRYIRNNFQYIGQMVV